MHRVWQDYQAHAEYKITANYLEPRLSVSDFVQSCERKSGTESLGSKLISEQLTQVPRKMVCLV